VPGRQVGGVSESAKERARASGLEAGLPAPATEQGVQIGSTGPRQLRLLCGSTSAPTSPRSSKSSFTCPWWARWSRPRRRDVLLRRALAG